MDCCVLSATEVGRLVHYNIPPCHRDHYHVPSKFAIQGVIDETYELVEGRDGRYYVTLALMYFIKATPSGPSKMKVIQRVKMPQLVALKPLR
jgi:hypothetical protein